MFMLFMDRFLRIYESKFFKFFFYNFKSENLLNLRQQFVTMASILNLTPRELALKVTKVEKEERYKQLKAFYLREYPKTNEFYEYFRNKNKLKRGNSSSIESQSKKFAAENILENDVNKADKEVDLDFSIDNLFNEKEKEIECMQNKKINDVLDDLLEENTREKKDKFVVDDEFITNDVVFVNKSTVDYDKLMQDLFE
jgi:hypothetical protein